jgi:hypothetical protein
MKLNATEFRKNLFTVLERVREGEVADIEYKGSAIQVKAARSFSKLARAKRRHALLCDPGDIVQSDKDLLADLEAEWEKDWQNL